MGAGKTTVGRALAARLGWDFADLDDRIEASEQRTIAEIFALDGEARFRTAEHNALQDWLSQLNPSSNRILALGGGAFAQLENQKLLASSGLPTIFLDAPVEELWRRCCEQNLARPLRGDFDQFRALYQSRFPYYLRASLRVETTGKAVETIAVEVANHLLKA